MFSGEKPFNQVKGKRERDRERKKRAKSDAVSDNYPVNKNKDITKGGRG